MFVSLDIRVVISPDDILSKYAISCFNIDEKYNLRTFYRYTKKVEIQREGKEKKSN